MIDLTQQFEDEDNKEYIERLKTRVTPFSPQPENAVVPKDSLTIVFNLNHMQVGESPYDYGFRGSIPLPSEGVAPLESRRGTKVKDSSPVHIPAMIEDGIPRGMLKVENRTGRHSLIGRPSLDQAAENEKQVVALVDSEKKILGIIRPGSFYFGEPPAGDLYLLCIDGATEALVSWVAFPGK